jgi:hypothetical protein
MEAQPVGSLPVGDEWQYEPKWDGFRCLAFREGSRIELQSKSNQPLARYFPELVAALEHLGPEMFLLDGEIAVPVGRGFLLTHCCNASILRRHASAGWQQKPRQSMWSSICLPPRMVIHY